MPIGIFSAYRRKSPRIGRVKERRQKLQFPSSIDGIALEVRDLATERPDGFGSEGRRKLGGRREASNLFVVSAFLGFVKGGNANRVTFVSRGIGSAGSGLVCSPSTARSRAGIPMPLDLLTRLIIVLANQPDPPIRMGLRASQDIFIVFVWVFDPVNLCLVETGGAGDVRDVEIPGSGEFSVGVAGDVAVLVGADN